MGTSAREINFLFHDDRLPVQRSGAAGDEDPPRQDSPSMASAARFWHCCAIVIHVPTAPWTHLVFDLLSWGSGLGIGAALYRWRLRDVTERLAARAGPGYFPALVGGAVPGAWLAGSFNTLREPFATLSHSVLGALAGAIIGVEIYKAIRGVRGSTGTIFVGSFTLGIVVGRWGCLFAGLSDLTYGTPTSLPWGVDLGDGIARHPVQIYESAAMALFLLVYVAGLRARRDWALRRSFYAMAAWYGVQRFAWEFLKPYPTLIGPFNLFHLISFGVACYGCAFFVRDLHAARDA
jgi:phosphatidylglycerol:prolipoprotein diacylglycerol transferase